MKFRTICEGLTLYSHVDFNLNIHSQLKIHQHPMKSNLSITMNSSITIEYIFTLQLRMRHNNLKYKMAYNPTHQ